MRAAGRAGRRRTIEDPPDFLESQQVPIERQRPFEIFHVEHDVAKIVGFHRCPIFPA